ncbi:MAG TPA: class I SAM-dependent methyltransferase [Anaerolineales bacterium]|nr:class I SAM-dependent methyltransferase [Anaerolineales bacterium]
MDPREYDLMYSVEDRHWWYQGMEVITRALLEGRVITSSTRLKILDAGCGTGAAMTTYLADFGEVTGVDLFSEALGFCRKRGATRIVRASVADLPLVSASFDLVTSFDVLYVRAVASDYAAMNEFARVLKPLGKVLLRLPAYDWLRGRHDERVHTVRRYTKKRISDLLKRSGFVVEHVSYANTFLFPIAVAKRLGDRIFQSVETQSDLSINVDRYNKVLRTILSSESSLVSGPGMPFGLSIYVVGRKRD